MQYCQLHRDLSKQCRFTFQGTIEEVNYQRSVTKLSIAGRVIDEHQITRHYKSAELQEMLRFNLNLDEPRPAQKPPADKILAKLLLEMENEIFKYHEHQALLENRPDEELNEEEMKLAWDEYHQEQSSAWCLLCWDIVFIYLFFFSKERGV